MNKELMTELFNTDMELLSTYHVLAPNSAEVCAERTISDLKDCYVYTYEKNGQIIGYYGIKGSQVAGFFITPENRNKEVITEFWNEVESHFHKEYYCGLYNKNTRAINFIRKMNIEEFPVPSYDGIFFKVTKESKCL